MNHVTRLVSSADFIIFSTELGKLCYIKKYRHRLDFYTQLLILLICIESFKVVLINMVTILMMSEKMATPGVRKIKLFRKNVMTS